MEKVWKMKISISDLKKPGKMGVFYVFAEWRYGNIGTGMENQDFNFDEILPLWGVKKPPRPPKIILGYQRKIGAAMCDWSRIEKTLLARNEKSNVLSYQ